MTTVSQTAFRHAMLDASQPVPIGLNDKGGAPAGKRFDVYRNNVAVGLTDALEAAFPVINKLVGAEFFKAMAGVYLRNNPPSSPLMMYYGDKMPGFLKGFEPAKSLAYLPDIARLEIAIREAYHAADADPVSSDALAALSPEAFSRARFSFAPSVRLISSLYPIYGIWAANMLPDAPAPKTEAQDVLVTRQRFDPLPHLLSRSAAIFIAALMEGRTLTTAMTRAGDDLDLGHVLALLFAQGAIIEITT